ncbi:MAG: DUF2723 domain-containing protein [Actinomycetota bacterium]|nr:DUF2723 domain-containing protein [Actinomycetota bacterium]
MTEGRFGAAGVALAGAGISLFVFILYLRTLAPTVLPYSSPDLLDAAMLQMQVAVLGISHPTGYPTYLMLSHLFTYLPVGDVAYRANLASAVWAALAVAAVYAAGLLLSRSVLAAAVGALTFGLGTDLWSQAVIAEVYPLNALFVALTVLSLLLWQERRRDRYLLLSALLTGLCLTNHLTSGLLLPAALLFVGLVERRKLLDWRLMLKAAGLFLLGLTPYLYLPVRSWMNAPFEGNNPGNVESFLYIVSGGNLRGTFFAFGPTELPGRLAFYWGHLLENANPLVVMVALAGAATMVVRDRAGAGLFGFLFIGWLFYSLGNDIPDIQLYFIPTYLVLCLWAALGLGTLLDVAGSLLAGRSRPTRGLIFGFISLALLLLPLSGVGSKYEENDRSEADLGRKRIEAVAENAARGATILHHRSELWYMVLVERRRQDLTLVDPFFHNRDIAYADIVWPDDLDLATTDRRYGTDDFTGVTAAELAAERGPVYIVNQQGISGAKPFLEADFDIIEVEKGILYELVPPGGESYTRRDRAAG